MVAIKDMKETPKDCKKCPLMGTHGTPTDYFKPMMCVAIWATKHEIRHCIGGKIRDDCPLVEIEERKVGKWIDGHCTNCGCDVPAYINDWKWKKDMNAKWCPQCGAEMRGNENDTKTSYKGI